MEHYFIKIRICTNGDIAYQCINCKLYIFEIIYENITKRYMYERNLAGYIQHNNPETADEIKSCNEIIIKSIIE